nr:glycosyltransferase [uncultured Carboxylicivirga sp.]
MKNNNSYLYQPDGISIIVCCYNSALRLPETIKHIAFQKVEQQIDWEVIVINNNSSDNTVAIAKKEWGKYQLSVPFSIYDEPNQGLSYARKKGVTKAKYENIIFCDDDNWLEEHYIQNAYELLNKHLNVGAIGGQGEAVSDTVLPEWFSKYENGYAIGKQASHSGIVNKRGYLWGAGIIIRKNILETVMNLEVKSVLTGRKGSILTAGDDSEMCKWALLLGYDLWYDESLKFKHFIPSPRLSSEYRERMWEGFDISNSIISKYDILLKIVSFNKNRISNFISGLKLNLTKNKNVSKTYIQFLLGPILKVSSTEDYDFIKKTYKLLYAPKLK